MTKQQALKEFKEHWLPNIKEQFEKNGQVDRPARCEGWNYFTDMLCREQQITLSQYEKWTNPF